MRQALLDGTLTRLLDPEEVLRKQIVNFVERGDFGFGSGPVNGGFQRVWWNERLGPEDVVFDDKTFLLIRTRAASLKEQPSGAAPPVEAAPTEGFVLTTSSGVRAPESGQPSVRLLLNGVIPPEQWNRLGTKLLPKLRASGKELSLGLNVSLEVRTEDLLNVEADIRQALRDLGIDGLIHIEKT